MSNPIPSRRTCTTASHAYREAKADIIVAIGGGSPLDVGKIIRLKARPGVHERPLVDYDDATGGDAYITDNMPPMLALPTTAGTGSEVGRSGVVTLDANGARRSSSRRISWPTRRSSIPSLPPACPPRTTAATGFDALTHCLEAYVSIGDHPMADCHRLGRAAARGRASASGGRARRPISPRAGA